MTQEQVPGEPQAEEPQAEEPQAETEPGEALPREWEEDPAREAAPDETGDAADGGGEDAGAEPEASRGTEAGDGEDAGTSVEPEAGGDGAEAGEDTPAAGSRGALKIVIDIQNERARVGVIREGADAHLEMLLDDDLQLIAAELPGVVARAEESWNTEPMRPRYQAPKKQASGKQPSGRRSQAKKDPPAGEGPGDGSGETTQPELEQQQTMMNRLF